jgi:copper chaperone NosL
MNFSNYKMKYIFYFLVCGVFLAGCSDKQATAKPPPATLSRDDTGYFCGMIVEDHLGPKSQIILKDNDHALWFTTARDGIAFLRLPEETRPILAFYVSALDLGGWDHPESDPANMVDAEQAWFVIESERQGSMGAPEAIPFTSEQAALSFIEKFGGRALRLDDIPDNYILGSAQTHSP